MLKCYWLKNCTAVECYSINNMWQLSMSVCCVNWYICATDRTLPHISVIQILVTSASFVIQLKYCAMKVSVIKCCVIGWVVANISDDYSDFIFSVCSSPRSRATWKDWVCNMARGGIPDYRYLYKRPDLFAWLFVDC
jgi:hypothetical protein